MHPSRNAWIAMASVLVLHLLLGVGQSQGWIPGERRWLGIGAMRREWWTESALGSIERLRSFGARWLDEAGRLPMDDEDFLNQYSRISSAIHRSLDPEVRWNPDRDAKDRWITTPAFDGPFRRYYAANGRFQTAVIDFYDEDSRGSLTAPRAAWKELEEALDGLRRTVERSR